MARLYRPRAKVAIDPGPEGCPDGARIIVIDSRGRRDEASLAA